MSNPAAFKIAVLVSGGGTTLLNLIEKYQAGELDAEIRLVISSNSDAGGIDHARKAEIECRIFDHHEFNTANLISSKIFVACREAEIDLVVMGGFLRKVDIPIDYANRVINIHPSLIPAFCGKGMYGMRVHQAVIENGSPVTGCTVHFVDNHYDNGPIIAQTSVTAGNRSAEELQKAVSAAECELYPRVINAIAQGEISVVGDEVVYSLALHRNQRIRKGETPSEQ